MNARRFNSAANRVLAGLCLAAVIGVGVPATTTARPAALRKCGTMHVRALRPAGYKTERLFVARGTSCAKGRRYVQAYYTSHAPCQGSGCFRTIGDLNCGGGQSSILGGVALLCTRQSDPSVVVIGLRVRPKPPPPSLETDRRAQSNDMRIRAAAATSTVWNAAQLRPIPSYLRNMRKSARTSRHSGEWHA
jgi:hypothetical protein